MSLYRVTAILTSVVAVGILAATPALAQVPPEQHDSYASTRTEQQSTSSNPACRVVSGEAAVLVGLKANLSTVDSRDGSVDYSGYPAGASGTSNGDLTAAQKGEPVGAGGTSGGSSSPFAIASSKDWAVARTSVSGTDVRCESVQTLATRRLIHADLIQVLRDGR